MSPTAQQLKREMTEIDARTTPALSEYCDGWLIIGIRAGEPPVSFRIIRGQGCVNDFSVRLENEILAMAAGIARRREHGG